jgi:hypothetical protein
MRRRGTVLLCLLAAAPVAAQPADVVATGYGAMPGGLHAPSAETLPKGVGAVAAFGGFGWRTGLLADDHRFGRGIDDLAFAYGATSNLTVALALDGRYDRHFGIPRSGDDGYVGDPRLIARLAQTFGQVRLGGQVGVWVPGRDAPSIAASAISVDARALLSVRAGPATVSIDGGFRLDNSARSAEDKYASLSLQDRVSLGVSEYHAAVGGVHLRMPTGRAFFGAEASIDLFVGTEAPGPLLRAGAFGGVHLGSQWSLVAWAELAKVPSIDRADVMAGDIPQIAYEPMVTGGLGLTARFGGGRAGREPSVVPNPDPQPIEVIEYAELAGVITDEAGKPVVGAKVTIKLRAHTATAVTDDKGAYKVRVPIGKTVAGATTLDDTGAELAVAVDGKKPASQTLTLVRGPNTVAKLALEPLLPPGTLKVVVRAASNGRPIANATLTVEPGGLTATTASDGTLSIEILPGTYKATVTATGHRSQTLDVTVDPNGVAIKTFELPK